MGGHAYYCPYTYIVVQIYRKLNKTKFKQKWNKHDIFQSVDYLPTCLSSQVDVFSECSWCCLNMESLGCFKRIIRTPKYRQSASHTHRSSRKSNLMQSNLYWLIFLATVYGDHVITWIVRFMRGVSNKSVSAPKKDGSIAMINTPNWA